MRILAFTDRRYAKATRKVVGWTADVFTSPPIMAADIQPFWLEGYDVIYLDLHGQAGSVRLWSGPQQQYGALDVKTVQATNLSGTVVFATTCFLPQTPFIRAFLEARAACVVGGMGENFGTRIRISGAQRLGKLFLDGLRREQGPVLALDNAKQRLRHSLSRFLRPKATKDALRFYLWERINDN